MKPDEFEDLELLEDTLRNDARRLLACFEPVEACPEDGVKVSHVTGPRSPDRRAAAIGTAVSGIVLVAACVLLAIHPIGHELTSESPQRNRAQDAIAAMEQTLSDAVTAETGRFLPTSAGRPVVVRLVDQNGQSIGVGLYFPERVTPIDFSELSRSEQEAALRLVGLDPADVLTTSI